MCEIQEMAVPRPIAIFLSLFCCSHAAFSADPQRDQLVADLAGRISQLEARLAAIDREQQDLKRALAEVEALRARLDVVPSPAPQAAPEPSRTLSWIPSPTPAQTPSPKPPPTPSRTPSPTPAATLSPTPSQTLSPTPATAPAPLHLQIGSADFTPGGFLDLIGVYRSTNVGSGIGTAFGSIPFSNTPAGQLSENRLSAQNSQISLKVSSRRGSLDLTGYVEADFLGLQPPNGHVSTNSNSLRMRLYWADLRFGKWEFLGGQSWSMLTPGRTGISPVPADLSYTDLIDTNYQAGLTWSRAPQLRLVHHTTRHLTLGLSFENPEQYVGPAVVLPPGFPAGTVDNGSNPGAPNPRPDIIVKAAWDGSVSDHRLHLETAGLLRGFRVADPSGGLHSANGTGAAVNLSFAARSNLRLILNTYWSSGGGRYLFGLGPDLIVRPDFSISPVRAASVLSGWEYRPNPAWMVYGYYSAAYFDRNYAALGNSYVGYGYPGSSSAANRAIQEPTVGLVRTLFRKPDYGALQIAFQYSYVQRNPWPAAPGGPASAHTHMFFQDLRYVLP